MATRRSRRRLAADELGTSSARPPRSQRPIRSAAVQGAQLTRRRQAPSARERCGTASARERPGRRDGGGKVPGGAVTRRGGGGRRRRGRRRRGRRRGGRRPFALGSRRADGGVLSRLAAASLQPTPAPVVRSADAACADVPEGDTASDAQAHRDRRRRQVAAWREPPAPAPAPIRPSPLLLRRQGAARRRRSPRGRRRCGRGADDTRCNCRAATALQHRWDRRTRLRRYVKLQYCNFHACVCATTVYQFSLRRFFCTISS